MPTHKLQDPLFFDFCILVISAVTQSVWVRPGCRKPGTFEWMKTFFQAITCQVFTRVFVISSVFAFNLVSEFLIVSSVWVHEAQVSALSSWEAAARFSRAEIRGMIRNMFCFVPVFSKGSVLQTSPLGAPVAGWLSVLKQFWVYSFMCPANNRPRLKGCQLVGSSSREASASLPTYPGYPYPTYPTYPNRLCPIWQQPTSCCQPRSLEISAVQCQEDSSVLKYWSSVLST